MDICESNKAVSDGVRSFMLHVKDAKEESITDYLVWKWRELDKRFNYLSVRTFNHNEESTLTGADYDLELWFVGSKTHISLVIQAKKFIKQYDSYVRKLRYQTTQRSRWTLCLNMHLAMESYHSISFIQFQRIVHTPSVVLVFQMLQFSWQMLKLWKNLQKKVNISGFLVMRLSPKVSHFPACFAAQSLM